MPLLIFVGIPRCLLLLLVLTIQRDIFSIVVVMESVWLSIVLRRFPTIKGCYCSFKGDSWRNTYGRWGNLLDNHWWWMGTLQIWATSRFKLGVFETVRTEYRFLWRWWGLNNMILVSESILLMTGVYNKGSCWFRRRPIFLFLAFIRGMLNLMLLWRAWRLMLLFLLFVFLGHLSK